MGALAGHIACQRASSPAQLGLPILSTLQLLLSPCLPLSPSEEDLKMGTGNSGELLVLRCWAISRHPQAQTLSMHPLSLDWIRRKNLHRRTGRCCLPGAACSLVLLLSGSKGIWCLTLAIVKVQRKSVSINHCPTLQECLSACELSSRRKPDSERHPRVPLVPTTPDPSGDRTRGTS